jgi:hypothetical protein
VIDGGRDARAREETGRTTEILDVLYCGICIDKHPLQSQARIPSSAPRMRTTLNGAQAGTAAAAAARSRLKQTAAGSRQQAVARRESAEIGGFLLLGRRLSQSGKSNQVVVFLLRGGGRGTQFSTEWQRACEAQQQGVGICAPVACDAPPENRLAGCPPSLGGASLPCSLF